MSMHFAPQWNKPIKPSGNALTTPTSENPHTTSSIKATRPSALNTSPSAPTIPSNVPFPALSQGGTTPTAAGNTSQPVLSYSRATHTPISPNFPRDGSYFPSGDPSGQNGHPHPFRYSKEAMLALWDEQKVKERPIELTDMGVGADILVSKGLVKPVGLRDLSEAEKKLLATSVHPPNPVRRQAGVSETVANGAQTRRPIGPPVTRETGTTRPGSIGGFGRGEGGAFGGTLGKPGAIGTSAAPGAAAENKPLGAIGGGFVGVKRAGRRTESGDAGAPWRPTRTISGSFEGVLGFGSGSSTAATQPTTATSNSASPVTPTTSSGFDPTPQVPNKVPEPSFGEGGGPGWGTGQKKWRIAAGLPAPEVQKELHIPVLSETRSDSVAATAPDTPLPERDATVAEPIPTPPQSAPDSPPRPVENVPTPVPPKEDLGAIQWYYRDPGGQEQGPFAASQMHDWYSHSYFTDDLPLRRAHETSFHSLAELKIATGNAVQPFLSPVRPRNLPPNLPIPFGAQPMSSPQDSINGTTDNFRHLNLNTGVPSHSDPRISPLPQQTFSHMPDRGPLNQYAPHPAYDAPAPVSAPYAQQPANAWGQPVNRVNNFGSVGMPSPIGQGPSPYSQRMPQIPQQQPQPLAQHAEFFSPSAGVGAVPQSPWAIPQQNVSQQDPSIISPPQAWQQPQLAPQSQYQPPAVELPAAQEPPRALPEAMAPVVEPLPALIDAHEEQVVHDDFETHVEPDEPIVVAPPTKTPSRKTPIDQPSGKSSAAVTAAPTPPSTSSSGRLPPAPASLPAKPVSSTAQTSPDKPSSRPAPWADKEGSRTTGLSLREIQEAEAKEAEARRANRPVAPSPMTTPGVEEKIQNMTWGLPTSQKGSAPLTSPATPATPVWGGGDAGPKKTLKQIQEEEEKRKAKVAQAQARTAVNGTSTPVATRRGYADLAATSQPGQATGPGWTTVGAGGKASAATTTTITSAPRPASIPAKPVTSIPAKPASITTSAVKPKANGADDSGPSIEFIKWAKQALTGLKINIDEFIQMLLSFPVDPPASSRGDVLEIISDSVYANSSTLDGRRFAEEFMTRRKADAARSKTTPSLNGAPKSASSGSLADVVKSVPKKSEDAGFRVVKAKGKKKN